MTSDPSVEYTVVTFTVILPPYHVPHGNIIGKEKKNPTRGMCHVVARQVRNSIS